MQLQQKLLPSPSLNCGAAGDAVAADSTKSSWCEKIQSIALSTLLSVDWRALTAWLDVKPMAMMVFNASEFGTNCELSVPGGTNGSQKSASVICSMTHAVAASTPELWVKKTALLHASGGKPIENVEKLG